MEQKQKVSDHNVSRWIVVNDYLITLINYKTSTPEERLFVFKNVTVDELQISNNIPKGFFDNHDIRPIAMFRPDRSGWEEAIKLCGR